MTTGWATTTLVAATITNGLMAGLFAAYSYAVMPGLGRTDDRTFVEAMQQTNAAILNGWFGICFGAAVLVITFGVNVPLNDRLAAAGDPATLADPAAVRAAFEQTWVRWNVVRAV